VFVFRNRQKKTPERHYLRHLKTSLQVVWWLGVASLQSVKMVSCLSELHVFIYYTKGYVWGCLMECFGNRNGEE